MDKPKVVVLAPLPAQMFEAFLDSQPEVSGVEVVVYNSDPGNPLLKSDKVMLSPHVAGGTNERGEKPLHVVNGVE
jgi:hypothetical protein